MKLKYNFVVKDVAGKTLAVAVGNDNEMFNGMIKLNATAKFIFEMLSLNHHTEEELVSALKDEYGIDEATAEDAVCGFLATLRENNLIEE